MEKDFENLPDPSISENKPVINYEITWPFITIKGIDKDFLARLAERISQKFYKEEEGRASKDLLENGMRNVTGTIGIRLIEDREVEKGVKEYRLVVYDEGIQKDVNDLPYDRKGDKERRKAINNESRANLEEAVRQAISEMV